MRPIVLCVLAAALSGCTVYPAPYPTRVYYPAPYATSEYYYYGPAGDVYWVRPHPVYGYVYVGGPRVTIGAPVPVGFHGVIRFGGHGARRHW